MGLEDLIEGSGLDRPIAMQGVNALALHQLQAVAIARMLIKDHSIFLLDHPFRLLDNKGTDSLLRLFQKRRGLVTTIVVSDEPRLLEMADQIILMKAGTVSFSGTPKELMSAKQKAAMQQAAMAGGSSLSN